jgi:hypothetical protein
MVPETCAAEADALLQDAAGPLPLENGGEPLTGELGEQD